RESLRPASPPRLSRTTSPLRTPEATSHVSPPRTLGAGSAPRPAALSSSAARSSSSVSPPRTPAARRESPPKTPVTRLNLPPKLSPATLKASFAERSISGLIAKTRDGSEVWHVGTEAMTFLKRTGLVETKYTVEYNPEGKGRRIFLNGNQVPDKIFADVQSSIRKLMELPKEAVEYFEVGVK
ncbi:MAG: hypothetical protein WC860_10090, partial [Candidatus Margulisiibacteriota bacterium]